MFRGTPPQTDAARRRIRNRQALYSIAARAGGAGASAVYWGVALISSAALFALAFSLEGPVGGPIAPRFGFAHAALVLLDPLLWDCARRSLFIAAATAAFALASAAIYVRIVGSLSMPRRLRWLLLAAPATIPPLLTALGAREIYGLIPPAVMERFAEFDWLKVVFVESVWAIPMALAAVPREALTVPWRDVALAAGGKRGLKRSWRPTIRPLLRAALWPRTAWIFALALAEPAAPLVLGVERTLPTMLVKHAAFAQTPQGFAVTALVIAAIGGFPWLLVLPVTRKRVGDFAPLQRTEARVRASRKSAARVVLCSLALFAWLLVAWAPVAGLVRGLIQSAPIGSAGAGDWFEGTGELLAGALVTSTRVGIAAAGLAVGIGWLARFRGWGWLSPVSPLVVGAGAWAFLELAAEVWPRASWVRSDWVFELSAVWVLAWIAASRLGPGWDAERKERAGRLRDFARGAGAGAFEAWWRSSGRALIPAAAAQGGGVAVFAAFEAGAMLLFARDTRFCTLGPAMLELASTPGALRALFVCALAGITISVAGGALLVGEATARD